MKNSEYWAKRFEILEESAISKGSSYFETLEAQYREASRTIESEISTWYQRFAVNNNISLSEARRLLNSSELKEFRWNVQDFIKYGEENALNQQWMKQLENASAKVHVSRLEALKIQTQQQMEILYGNQVDGIDTLARKIYSDAYYHTAYEIQKGFNVGWDLQSINDRQLEKVLYKPWTADNQTFRDKCWTQKANLVSTVQTELTQSIMRGDSPDKAIKTISEKFNVAKSKAGRLVMTESAYFSSEAQKNCFNELDVEKYEIVATLDSHTSNLCQSLDGQVFEMKDYQPGVTAPPFHPWCRTTTVPYFEDNYGERAARDAEGNTYYVPSNMKYGDWKKSFVGGGNKDGLKEVDASDIIKNQDRSKAQTSTNPEVQKILDKYPVIEDAHTYSEDIQATNPKYKTKAKAYTQNCQRCVNAYEARRRGYDVTASERIFGGNDSLPYMMMDKGWANVYANGRSSLVQCFSRTTDGVKKKVIEQMTSWGKNARAIVRVQWKGTRSGHVFIAENHDGSILFLDPQSGTLNVESYFDMAKVNQTHLLRIDDKEFSTLIEKCCDYLGK